ncbi:PREDICTED: uncharacterized protein LOC109582643 [Amphimedon queenslandica]|uniref:G-protein coupled receptors family 2 profile 2 domain-containing protein n=1 Tax=Amphimedon queenslandica TaxID=400682 RepID=A0A1X7UPI9_AMPQE|nr:PREDICTED: uncharacterized protein LOC109582643 [Amphimedon queenslandica]|eukprot:XP_019853042.1 PREDICTED: uncharacterized protein LOC109582643 [Amphimedon queenslandica]
MEESTNLTCHLTDTQYKVLIGIRSSIAIISFLACLFVIGHIVLFKKYLFRYQRMILYLDIVLILYTVIEAINSFSYDLAAHLLTYCKILGFLELYISLSVVVAITCFTIDIFLKVSCQVNTDTKHEVVYILLMFLSPILVTWIPFYTQSYGFAGAWCWIKTFQDKSCTRDSTAVALQFLLYYIPLFILYPILFLLLLITLCRLYRQRYNYTAQVDPHAPQRRTALRKEIKLLLPYPFIILLTKLVPLFTRVYRIYAADTDTQGAFALWIVDAFFISITGAVIAVSFSFNPGVREQLKWAQIRAACRELICWHRHRVREYTAAEVVRSDSRSLSFTLSGSINTENVSPLLTEFENEELSTAYRELED